MATQSAFVWDESFTASGDLSSAQYTFVKLSAGNTVAACSAATDVAIGVLQNKPKSGQAAKVRILGKTFLKTDGSGTSIAAGDYVGTNSSGVGVKKATADYTIRAISNGASSANGTVIDAWLLGGPGVFRTAGG